MGRRPRHHVWPQSVGATYTNDLKTIYNVPKYPLDPTTVGNQMPGRVSGNIIQHFKFVSIGWEVDSMFSEPGRYGYAG